MEGRYNIRSPAVKRLMKEAQELSEPTDQYFAQPLEDNLFEWHFTVRGPADSDFQNGIYHGRIILPVDYPMKPPSIIWLTPNGRFETNKKICLSISGHHPESWQPSWSIRTALLAIIGFMPTHPGGAIGSLDYKPEEKKLLAKKSRTWKCPVCDDVSGILLDVTPESQSANKEAQELAAQISFQGEKPKSKTDEDPPKEEEKKNEDKPLPESDAQAATPTSPEIGPEMVSSPDVAKTSTNVQTSSSVPVAAYPASITSSSSQLPPTVLPPAPTVFSSPASSASGMPPWSAVPPFPPQNFYNGQSPYSCASTTLPLRFPYPPSFYSTAYPFYPPGCALPPGVGVFPCPFPPPPLPPHASRSCAPSVISLNNSSAPGSAPSSAPRPRAQTYVSYSRSPMSCPSVSVGSQAQRAEASGENVRASSSPKKQTIDPEERQDHSQVLDELLTKVKRVGSEENSMEVRVGKERQESEKINEKEPLTEVSKEKRDSEKITVKEPYHEELSVSQAQSDTATCLKKTNSAGDVSTSEVIPSDTENSEASLPPFEVSDSDQRTVLEKSTCNSTSELEKWKLKRLQTKGLRQRQSATASINAEVSEEVNPSPDPSGQRIEAESGDSGPRNRLQPGDQGPLVGQAIRNMARRAPGTGLRYNSRYDSTFFAMVVLFICTVGILLNRLLMMYWAEDLSSKPT